MFLHHDITPELNKQKFIRYCTVPSLIWDILALNWKEICPRFSLTIYLQSGENCYQSREV